MTTNDTKKAADATMSAFVEALCAQMQRGYSEHFMQYMKFIASGHSYSAYNTHLIFAQAMMRGFVPTAVKGYQQWAHEGYQVAKGQKGLSILIPSFKKERGDDGVERSVLAYFRTGYVFDASQLQRTPQSRPAHTSDTHGLYALVMDAMRAEHIRVAELDAVQLGAANGVSVGGAVAIRADLDEGNKVLVALHEWTHEYLHHGLRKAQDKDKEERRRIEECHAEAVSYIVASFLGLETTYSADYLKSWGNTPQSLKAELETITEAAQHIIAALRRLQSEAEQHQDALPDAACTLRLFLL